MKLIFVFQGHFNVDSKNVFKFMPSMRRAWKLKTIIFLHKIFRKPLRWDMLFGTLGVLFSLIVYCMKMDAIKWYYKSLNSEVKYLGSKRSF